MKKKILATALIILCLGSYRLIAIDCPENCPEEDYPPCPSQGAAGYSDPSSCESRSGCTATPAIISYGSCDPVLNVQFDHNNACYCGTMRDSSGEVVQGSAICSIDAWFYSQQVAEIGICTYTDSDSACCNNKASTDFCNVNVYPAAFQGYCVGFCGPCNPGVYV